MVTVAKSLDVPIKLVFPRPAPADSPASTVSHAMLGLGDVVLPGIMIGLALRFDLYLFYLRKQKRVQTGAKSQAEEIVEKPKYFSLAGRWSDYFWTHSFFGRPLFEASEASKPEQPFTFPKTYFKASIVGYVLGMLTTLGVMQIWGHAQPALLYLVPGVLGSLWLTALASGELRLMWDFTEAVEEEEDPDSSGQVADKETKSSERSSFFSLKQSQEREARMKKSLRQHVTLDSDSEDETENEASGDGSKAKKSKVKEVAGHKSEREVFSLSIEAPWTLRHPRSIRTDPKDEAPGQNATELIQPKDQGSTADPARKRVRLK
jgi:minor histocompatibility antigen H13